MVESCFHRTAPSSSRLRNFQITSLLRQARISDLQATLPGKEEHVRRPKSQHETKKKEGKCFASLTCCRCRRRRLPRRRQQLHVSSTSPHRSNEQPRHSPPPSLVPLYSSPRRRRRVPLRRGSPTARLFRRGLRAEVARPRKARDPFTTHPISRRGPLRPAGAPGRGRRWHREKLLPRGAHGAVVDA